MFQRSIVNCARYVLGAMYILSGFFVLALHAETLDAPTLVFQEYQETLSHTRIYGEKGVLNYLRKNMKDADTEKVAELARHINQLARRYHFPSGLILSIIRVESNFQPWAVSPRGAMGLMQIMPETGQWLAEKANVVWESPTQLLDEQTNVSLGVAYLAFLRDKYNGDLKKMLSAYNRGPAKVDEEVAEGRDLPLSYYYKIRQYLPKFALGKKES